MFEKMGSFLFVEWLCRVTLGLKSVIAKQPSRGCDWGLLYFDLLQQYQKVVTPPDLCSPLSGFTKRVGYPGRFGLEGLRFLQHPAPTLPPDIATLEKGMAQGAIPTSGEVQLCMPKPGTDGA